MRRAPGLLKQLEIVPIDRCIVLPGHLTERDYGALKLALEWIVEPAGDERWKVEQIPDGRNVPYMTLSLEWVKLYQNGTIFWT